MEVRDIKDEKRKVEEGMGFKITKTARMNTSAHIKFAHKFE